ncbi:MAG: ribose 5-phosphate isomerase B [Chloroflexota bacterium]|nr:ribose 5-phosphate isomerase B [Chloroflexota bacterium]
MINGISDEAIHTIVQRIVRQSMGDSTFSAKPIQPQNIDSEQVDSTKAQQETNPKQNVVAIGADHGGLELKEILKKFLVENNYQVIDCGTHTKDSVDYPDIALAVAELVASDKAWRGVIIDGAGIGSCMAANKVPGVRAALCYDYATAVNSREHNDANVLTLGAGLIGINLAKQIITTWLATDFGGGRHARRVDKITAIGNRFLKDGKIS